MAVSEKDLDYEHYLSRFDPNFRGNKELLQKIMRTYTQRVIEAIHDVHLDVLRVSEEVESSDARLYLSGGVGRRTKFLWLSLQSVLNIAPPERTTPPSIDDCEEFNLNLNTIYINIRGVLDCFSWCLRHMFIKHRGQRLPDASVDLFLNKFVELLSVKGEVAEIVNSFKNWNTELKSRRDPAVHRIPLFAERAIIDDASIEEYREIKSMYDEACCAFLARIKEGNDASTEFDKRTRLYEDLQRVGVFKSSFVNPAGTESTEEYPIYPTVPQDVGNLAKISRGLISIIQKSGQMW